MGEGESETRRRVELQTKVVGLNILSPFLFFLLLRCLSDHPRCLNDRNRNEGEGGRGKGQKKGNDIPCRSAAARPQDLLRL